MKIFLGVASLKKSYGGPAFSVSQLSGALTGRGGQVCVWTPDGSAATSDLVPTGVEPMAGDLAECVRRFAPDLIHDNGIWLPHNHRLATLSRRLRIARVVSTRGMLEPWAFRHKGWKKKLAWTLYQRRDLVGAAALHATAGAEAANLAALALGPKIEVISNGIATAKPGSPFKRGPMTALFMGRLYPVKGLPMLIEAWGRVSPPGWSLRLAGPDEAGHRAELEALVVKQGLTQVVEFLGPLSGEAKVQAFEEADLFVLPSHSESFGMAAGEALSHGLPVLTTTAVPWPMLEEEGCGWRAPPSVDGLADGLKHATARTRRDLAVMGSRGRTLILERFSWASTAAKMIALYESVVFKP